MAGAILRLPSRWKLRRLDVGEKETASSLGQGEDAEARKHVAGVKYSDRTAEGEEGDQYIKMGTVASERGGQFIKMARGE